MDNIDEKLKEDLTGLIKIAREHGHNSREVERYLLNTVRNYDSKGRRAYLDLAAGYLLIMPGD